MTGKKWILNVSNFFPGKGQENIPKILNQVKSLEDVLYIQVCSDIEFNVGKTLESSWKLKTDALKYK